MQYSQLLALFGAATLVAAKNVVTFKSLDNTARTVHFTPNDGYPEVSSVQVSGGETTSATIPEGWIGNWYAISEGKENVPGMLGEVAFQGWGGDTYFDVSAIIDAADHDGVKEMWPAQAQQPTSGCENFPCDNAYYLSDDVQTKVTSETEIICTLGKGASPLNAREQPAAVGREYLVGTKKN